MLAWLKQMVLYIKYALNLIPFSGLLLEDKTVRLLDDRHHSKGSLLYQLGFSKGTLSRGPATWFQRHFLTKVPESLAESRIWQKVSDPADLYPSLTIDPEFTILTAEECIYLVQIGKLAVKRRTNDWFCLSVMELWHTFKSLPNFAQKYCIYTHFKSKGWQVRPGNIYGADFCLYRECPSLSHSDYAVYLSRKPPDEIWIMSRLRVCTQVKKTMIFSLVEGDFDDHPDCIFGFKQTHALVKRWIPEKTRS
jgi:tRNA-intron lyase